MARSSDSDDGGVNLGVIITPMLDMAFQLLAFSVIAYNPSPQEGHYKIEMILPPEKKPGFAGPKQEKEKDVLPVVEEPKLGDVLLVKIRSLGVGQAAGRQEGEIREILLKRPENNTFEAIANTAEYPAVKDPDSPNNPNRIALARLAQELDKLGAKSADIKLQPDADLRNEYVMGVMGTCLKKGFTKVSFVDPD